MASDAHALPDPSAPTPGDAVALQLPDGQELTASKVRSELLQAPATASFQARVTKATLVVVAGAAEHDLSRAARGLPR